MKKSYKDFLEQVSGDDALKEKLTSIDTTDEIAIKQNILNIAKENGYDLSMEDLQSSIDNKAVEVSDDEMDAVSGGSGDEKKGKEGHLGCACPMVGGGGGYDSNDNNKYGCACVLYGQGGDGRGDDFNCACLSGGVGFDNGGAI